MTRVKGRAAPVTADTPFLITDLASILDPNDPSFSYPDPTFGDLDGADPYVRAVDLVNLLGEFGWRISRLDEKIGPNDSRHAHGFCRGCKTATDREMREADR